MKVCEKCGKQFKTKMVIDGKKRNLYNRKYCIDCSPFGEHNTKKFSENNILGEKQQLGKYDKETSLKIRRKQSVQAVQRRREKIKQMAVEYKGGQCCICGYKKYFGALEFHHINPEEKEFNISSGSCKSWDKIKEELDKCILVCSNCHKEIEGGIIQLNDINT